MIYPNLGKVMRERGLTQKAIAEKLSVRENTVSDWFSGRHQMTIETAFDMRDRFFEGMNIEYLFTKSPETK